MRYPKMLPEVIEAIETHFCDEKDVMVDCMLYLMNATAREEDAAYIYNWFVENNRCTKCGDILCSSQYRQYHPELGIGVYETLNEWYCPECGGMNE